MSQAPRPKVRGGPLRPQYYLPALGLAGGGSALSLLWARFLDVNTLSAGLFSLTTYDRLGLRLAVPGPGGANMSAGYQLLVGWSRGLAAIAREFSQATASPLPMTNIRR